MVVLGKNFHLEPIELSVIIAILNGPQMRPLKLQTVMAGLVWIICGVVVVALKVGLFARSASGYWEYVGGFMILFGLVRLLIGFVRGNNTKPGFWSRIV